VEGCKEEQGRFHLWRVRKGAGVACQTSPPQNSNERLAESTKLKIIYGNLEKITLFKRQRFKDTRRVVYAD
jgi:hypothetical protein